MHSCLFEGTVRHRRNFPTVHQFNFNLFMFLIDLDEVDEVCRKSWLFRKQKFTFARFDENRHLKSIDNAGNLKARAIHYLRDNGIESPIGSIRLLTQVSYLGFMMNPVCFYFCYDPTGESVIAIIAEVNNTPWGEQHLYLVTDREESHREESGSTAIRSEPIDKCFHVSPFMSLNMDYRMAFSLPGKRMAVKIENHINPNHDESQSRQSKHQRILDVTMLLERKPLSVWNLNLLFLKYPLISVKSFAAIYWHALRLYLKKVRFYPHPRKTGEGYHDPVQTIETNQSESALVNQ